MRHDLNPATQRAVARPPHLVLGLPPTATAAEARLAYLDAVRRHPPDRDAERFRDLHAAMQAFCEPLTVAEAAFEPPQQMPELAAVVTTAAARPPRLPTAVLLAFGNLPSGDEQ